MLSHSDDDFDKLFERDPEPSDLLPRYKLNVQKKSTEFNNPPEQQKGSTIKFIFIVLFIFICYLPLHPYLFQNVPMNIGFISSSSESSNDVWISRGGEKYHLSPDCSNMENPIHTSKHDARLKGYQPCRKCFPYKK